MVPSINTYSACEPPCGRVTSLLHFTFLNVFVFYPSGVRLASDQKAWFPLSGTFQFSSSVREGGLLGLAFVNYVCWTLLNRVMKMKVDF